MEDDRKWLQYSHDNVISYRIMKLENASDTGISARPLHTTVKIAEKVNVVEWLENLTIVKEKSSSIRAII